MVARCGIDRAARDPVCSMSLLTLQAECHSLLYEPGTRFRPFANFPGVHWNKHHTLGAVKPVAAGPKTWC